MASLRRLGPGVPRPFRGPTPGTDAPADSKDGVVHGETELIQPSFPADVFPFPALRPWPSDSTFQ